MPHSRNSFANSIFQYRYIYKLKNSKTRRVGSCTIYSDIIKQHQWFSHKDYKMSYFFYDQIGLQSYGSVAFLCRSHMLVIMCDKVQIGIRIFAIPTYMFMLDYLPLQCTIRDQKSWLKYRDVPPPKSHSRKHSSVCYWVPKWMLPNWNRDHRIHSYGPLSDTGRLQALLEII